MILVGSANGSVGMAAGMAVLRAGGTALDAVEAATRDVEANPEDHSVGVGGYPNALGQVELDASVMDGTSRRAGAVAALSGGFPHPVSVARAILEHLPEHVLLVGDGAARFAREQGFAPSGTWTPEAEQAWQDKKRGIVNEDVAGLSYTARQAQAGVSPAGTVNFLAQDSAGHLASAVSTSGWAFKYPGRAGDSPQIGAGNYCDGRWGACACTGLGEWAVRGSTARTVVLLMEMGLGLNDACRRALDDLQSIPLPPGIDPIMNLVALGKDSQHAAYSTSPDRFYVWQRGDMDTYETTPRRTP